ncbi:hypothetical protein [Ulvibacterium sp.]|uniref:hypothetical protein n=1 Tax=Ulvibacterium sp. TaxID=2665914 RepID=UPI002626BB13|nr:hypothetical protein [Ulvibacterium sp.]
MKTIRIIPVLFAIVTCLSGCSDDDDNGLERSDCNEVVCTLQFVTLNVTIRDASGVVIPLDAFEVTIVKSGEDITREVSGQEFENLRQNGIYPLFGDEFADRYRNNTEIINFKGFIEGKEVVNNNYEVGADCCHVLLVHGDLNIIID